MDFLNPHGIPYQDLIPCAALETLNIVTDSHHLMRQTLSARVALLRHLQTVKLGGEVLIIGVLSRRLGML